MYTFRSTNLNLEKELTVSLKSILGLGWYKANYIITKIGLPYPFFINDLNLFYKDLIFIYLENYVMSEANLNRDLNLHIKKIIALGNYKGVRHELNLPVRGQRTRTNAGTQRSKRRKIEEINKLNEKANKYANKNTNKKIK